MSEPLVLDSFALVALFHEEPGWQRVQAALYEQEKADTRAFLNGINWGGFLPNYIVKRRLGAVKANEALRLLEQLPLELTPVISRWCAQQPRSKARMPSPMPMPSAWRQPNVSTEPCSPTTGSSGPSNTSSRSGRWTMTPPSRHARSIECIRAAAVVAAQEPVAVVG